MEYVVNNFVKYCLLHGGTIRKLDIESNLTNNTGICNPSILIDGHITRLVLRNVNYALWNCDNEYKFTSPYGPLCYITPDDDLNLRTKNFLCEINPDQTISTELIEMKFDTKPLWEFVGLEDCRLVRWDGKLYITGVRRDTTTNGQGRMELSEISDSGVELSRVRIKAPGDDSSYCEKNWMPILDMPFHYIKWCNPLEIVKVNPITGDSEIVIEKQIPDSTENLNPDYMATRGSSQVVRCGDYYIAITHLCHLWMNEKNQKSGSGYFEQFFLWDSDWNLVKISQPFKFAEFGIEFTNGLAVKDNVAYIPFALQDGISFLLTVNIQTVLDFIFNGCDILDGIKGSSVLLKFFNEPCDSYNCITLAQDYYSQGHYAASMILSERACEYNTFTSMEDLYEAIFVCGNSIAKLPGTDIFEKSMWYRMIDLFPNRSEGYLMLAKYYMWREQYQEAYSFARLAYTKNYYRFNDRILNRIDGEITYIKTKYFNENYLECEGQLKHLLETAELYPNQKDEIMNFIVMIQNNKANRYRVL